MCQILGVHLPDMEWALCATKAMEGPRLPDSCNTIDSLLMSSSL